MKKRIVALALTAAMTIGLGSTAWAEALPEATAPVPEVSAQVQETETPQQTDAPESTQGPQESAPPAEQGDAEPEDSRGADPVETPILDEPYALPGVEDFAVTEAAPSVEPYTALPSGTPPYSNHWVNGVSPSGTTINLFDYWISEQTAQDNNNPTDMQDKGINNGHALLFGRGMPDNSGDWNAWTGSSNLRTGIVSQTLGKDGYPQLSGENQGYVGRDGTESLAYLFDPDVKHAGKASYPDVRGLLQVDRDGYYHYNSQENYAVYYEKENSFTLYEYPGVKPGGNSPVGQFFPFNAATSNASWDRDSRKNLMNTVESNDSSINHYFGLHMSTRFIQRYEGYTDENQKTEVTYDFSGDDDVWIFIDGTLVADLGGIHDAASVSINFATGEIRVNGQPQDQRLGRILGYNTDTLPDNTYHTLDFFYLERGNVDSNMNLKYNLVTIPESSLIKVDQIGDPVPGAVFRLYAADDTQRENPIATGTTGRDGSFVFLDENDFPITLQNLYTKYGGVGVGDGTDLVLVEEKVPAGYRSAGEIELYFYETAKEEVLLLSNSVWNRGVYAMSKVTATAPNVIRDVAGSETVTLTGAGAVENPLMFAVVYQKQDNGTWLPISGDPISGWKVEADNSWNSVLNAAKANPYVFQLASSGAYQVEVENLPGDIKSYFHINGNEKAAKYTIGYYYTEAKTLEQATGTNSWRIDADPTDGAEQYALERVFSVNLYVPNIKNRLLVQKVDDQDQPDTVTGAEFTLYQANQVTVDGTTVTPNNVNVYYDRLTTQDLTKTQNKIMDLQGGGIFPTAGKVLEAGEYYLIETSAPGGYVKNETAVHVVVDGTGVYADAGVAEDGVTVLRGAGSVVRSMVQFAADDGVDTTLHNIKAALNTNVVYSSGQMTYEQVDWSAANLQALHLEYHNSDGLLDYGLHTSTSGAESGSVEQVNSLTLATNAGWSRLEIQQCSGHRDSTSGANYTELNEEFLKQYDETCLDLNNLFSGTVTVRVENDRTGNLTIRKTVTAENDNAPVGDAFTFTVTVEGASGIYQTMGGQSETINFDNGTATVTLQANQSLTILGLPTGAAYTVEETPKAGYTPSVTVTPEGGGTADTENPAKVTGTIQHNTTQNDAVELSYTNAYKEVQTLTVTKTVGGNLGDTTREFSFTLQVRNGHTPYRGELTAIEGPQEGQGVSQTLQVAEDSNSYTFDLKHGEEIAISIPKGYTVTVTETAVDGYTTTAQLDDQDYEFSQPGGYTVTETMITDHTVAYRNVCELAAPPSGVAPENPGFSVMLWVAGASAVVIFGCSFLVWRRRRRDWM